LGSAPTATDARNAATTHQRTRKQRMRDSVATRMKN
jgi:hypothetical protein